ncbi:patatin-like phospholipase family protein [uncultured Sphingomonas sp.]|uniref:patatin-like phospholipase family protein n=1 Tax=uncultured Sphingomonas sp. TaxID=158754 RepID=UPI0035C9D062
MPDPGAAVVASAAGARSFGDLLDRTLLTPPRNSAVAVAGRAVPDPSMLFLSGGSLHGAFGAGLLDEWRRTAPRGRLPEFKVVTGISTGAILATFAFLNRTEDAVRGYSIGHERELLTPIVSVRNGVPTEKGYVDMLRKGAVADLSPLRQRLIHFIDKGALEAVAAEAGPGRERVLLVGVVDVDTGQALALDLTEMARRYAAERDEAERVRLQGCYVEAILASSSAPMAALPVFIDNRMYVDGGVRFGMFSDEIGDRIERSSAAAAAGGGPRFYVVVNGDQELSARCGKADAARHCARGDPPGNYEGVHRKWRFTELALRSEQMLANQVYRFSASTIETAARNRGVPFHLAKIGPDMSRHRYTLDDPALGRAETMTCEEWRKEDRKIDDPVQFYPRYMRCVIDYGRASQRTGSAWGSAKPPK